MSKKKSGKKTKKPVKKAAKNGKKKTHKTAAKKAARNGKKKTTPRVKVTVRKKMLGKAPEEKSFYLEDGRALQTVHELVDELETMTDETFREYVHHENHFANWIEGVFDQRSLAEELRQIEDRMEAQRAILKHLVRELTKLANKKA